MEAWIEIEELYTSITVSGSPPSWRRGLKSRTIALFLLCKVASFVEAWIEIHGELRKKIWGKVASFVEAWIEIIMLVVLAYLIVASFVEAWIEIRFRSNPR